MNLKIFYISALLLIVTTGAFAQNVVLKGRVISSVNNKPVSQANVSSPEATHPVVSNENGEFTLTLYSANTSVSVLHNEYITQSVFIGGRNNINVYLVPTTLPFYYQNVDLTLSTVDRSKHMGSSVTVSKSELNEAYDTPEEGMHGKIAGLRVLSKSSMPGEGAYMNLRGIRSIYSSNLPLIVVDGVPFLSHTDESMLLTGYSQSLYMPMHMKEVESVSVVKGADAAMYGSLGSNGVINITTEKARNLDTQIEFQTVEGFSWMNKRIPVLDANHYRSYMGDVGETAYSDLDLLTSRFPFLKDDPEYHYNYIYNNDTNWQNEIFTPALTSENILKIKGGDAVANYAISVGYLYNKGVVEKTDMNKFYTRMNTDIKVTRDLTMFVNSGFTYYNTKLMEQGMSSATNPLLTALHKSPLLGPYEKDNLGRDLGKFSQIVIGGDYGPTKDATGISNPSAIVNTLNASSDGFNVLVNVGLKYDLTNNWAVTGVFGVNYAYNREDIFIPGKTSLAIAPVSEGARNTVRSGVNESNNMYAHLNSTYKTTLNCVHNISATAGFQALTTKTEYDFGTAINTNSDFYKTLQSSTTTFGRSIGGYTYVWNWMDGYVNATYDFKNQLYVRLGVTADASSSIGTNNDVFAVYPAATVGVDFKNTSLLRNVKDISQLTLRAEFAQLPNSRYSSSYSAYQYGSERYRDQTGIVRINIPNTHLKPEVNNSYNVGLDFATYGRKFSFSVDGFVENTKNMLNPKERAASWGYGYIYDNSGEMQSYGGEASAQAIVVKSPSFEWIVGANISAFKSKIVDLGGVAERLVTFSDGTVLINRVGETPYSFYGYQADGVFSTQAEADAARLVSFNGHQFGAGDIKFRDLDNEIRTINGDDYNIIDEKDRVLLGSAMPDFFGGFFASFKYKNFGLLTQFTYSHGNKIYNAVRRTTESMSTFDNQSDVVIRRWVYDGQVTDIPKASYGDPAGNSRFSSRWIEDGSYLRLKYVTLSYTIPGSVNKFFRQIDVYATGENLLTFTKYLGLDPEFSYNNEAMMQGMDLGKSPLAKSIRLGVKMNF